MGELSNQICVYGKLPWAGDFIRVGDLSGVEPLLDWVEAGIAVGAARGTVWRAAFESGAQVGFVFPVGTDSILVGVLVPSVDAVGRRFPLLVAHRLAVTSLTSYQHLLPLCLGSYLQTAGDAVARAVADERESRAAFSRISVPDLSQLANHHDSYSGWVQAASLRTLGQAVLGAQWRDSLGQALRVIMDSVDDFRPQEWPRTPLGVRLPLGTGFGGAAAFWLDAVQRCAGWRRTVPASFWSFEPTSAAISVYFGQLAPSAFADLWEPRPNSDSLSDLSQVGAVAAIGSVPSQVAQAIADPSSTVFELLRALIA